MPEEVDECVDSVLEDNPDYDESRAYAICEAEQKGYDDPEAVAAVALKQMQDEWPGIHPAEKTSDGRDHLLNTHTKQARAVSKALQPETSSVKFKAELSGPSAIFKVSDGDDDRFVIWGKASVEVVDKEGDKITGEALKEALPQLLRRERLSLEHSDQIVGDIKEEFTTEEPVEVEIDGKSYTRDTFPTNVLKIDGEEPALFVAGEVWDDTRQARQTREDIENGDIDSYSISGEAISTATKVKDGEVYDEIRELDLSAVTLCEEGMNQEAKFGTVTKESDDPATADTASAPPAVVKTAQHMSNDEDTKSDSEGSETLELSRDDLHASLKEATEDALAEADFVTTEQMKSYVDEKMEDEQPPSDPSEEAPDADDEEEEEKEDSPDTDADGENRMDEEAPDEEPESPEGNADDEKADDDEEVDPDEIEDPDDDGEEELDLDPAEDDEVVPDEEEKEGYSVEELEAELPDDLYDAVCEHLGVDEAGTDPVEDEVEDVELSEDGGDMDGDVEKAVGGDDLASVQTDGEYLEMTTSASIPETEEEDLTKSFEREDVGDAPDTEPGALNALYEDLGESPTHE